MSLEECTNGPDGRKQCSEGQLLTDVHDLTQTSLWDRTEMFFSNIYAPSFGELSNAEDPAVSPDGKLLAFTGHVWNSLQGGPNTGIYILTLSGNFGGAQSPSPVAATRGPYTDRKPKWSPDGKTLAFLSDRLERGQHQLSALATDNIGGSEPSILTSLDGIVEEFCWSPDGKEILIGLAGFGLPKAGFDGSGLLVPEESNRPGWMPTLKTNVQATNVRSLWVHNLESYQTRRVSLPGRNVWRHAWYGLHDALVLISDRPGEGAYKDSDLVKMSIHNGHEKLIIPADNEHLITEPSTSPCTSKIAFIESVGGDRTKLAGCIVWVDSKTSNIVRIIPDVDVSSMQWTGQDTILAVGLRDLTTVALEVNTSTQVVREIWSTTNGCGPSFPQPAATPEGGFAIIRQGWELAPELGLVGGDGTYTKLLSFDHDGRRWLAPRIGKSHTVSWTAPDGLEIQGFLYLPPTTRKPYPLILNIHGGPISAFVDQWMGYREWVAFLVAHGYSVLNPNPRGSVGRGRAFTEAVVGDVGGHDASDLLSGVEDLVSKGIADPARLGVIGGSYGGFQSAWLTTLTSRFAAAILISPVSDWSLQWLSSDLRQRILDNRPYDMDSLYFTRSPLRNVKHCKTPTLQLVGSLDNCTPTPQAHYYHTALIDHGVKSTIVEYPLEGHGIRQFPAMIDASCRMLSWFDRYMPANL